MAETSTTAASVDDGIVAMTSRPRSSAMSIAAAAAAPASPLLPPAASLTAVRESVPAIAKPPRRPETRFPAPSAINSWLASIA